MRDIREMLIQLHGENDLPRFGGYYITENGKQNPCFNLPKRETLIPVSGYSVELRAANTHRRPLFLIATSTTPLTRSRRLDMRSAFVMPRILMKQAAHCRASARSRQRRYPSKTQG